MEPGSIATHQQNNNRTDDIDVVEEHGQCDDVVISIEEMLRALPPINTECCLYRVNKSLLMSNETAYTPQVISIGPFHHGKPNLKAAEQLKLQALKIYLHHINMRVEDAMSMARRWEKTARACYGEIIDMNSDQFVKMMLIDGCFILAFMLGHPDGVFDETEKKSIRSVVQGLVYDIYRDIKYFENQLPFFVLQDLFDLLPRSETEDVDSFIELMAQLMVGMLMKPYILPLNVILKQKVRHLVDLVRFFYIPSPETEEYKKNIGIIEPKFLYPPTLTELCEAGVKLQKAEEAKSLSDFSFKDGVLKIPPININDFSHILQRNLMASEIFRVAGEKPYIYDYVAFLDGLINTEKDVNLLVKEKILTNMLGGSDEEVAKLINNLYLNAPFIPKEFYNHGTSRDLHDYCNRWWNRSLALLRRDYFHSPWSSISFVAATFLLLLTLLQTLFSAPYLFQN